MDPPEDNFAFDFFEEAPPSGRRRGMRGHLAGRGGGRGGPPREFAPLLRLAAVVCVTILVLLLFALGVSSCASTSTATLDANYMSAVSGIAHQSASDGSDVVSVLTTPGLTLRQMVTKLKAVTQAEERNVHSAEALNAPGPLRAENADMIEALQLRVLGLIGLSVEVGKIDAKGSTTTGETTLLAGQTERLLASDVVWDDLFMKPATSQLSRAGVSGVTVPDSHFLADPGLIETPAAIGLVVSRVAVQSSSTNGTSCSGVHGTSLVSVAALAKGKKGKLQLLNTTGLNTITSDSSLIFEATIHDAGNYQEVQIPVELTLARPAALGGPLTTSATVPIIDPGEDATVTLPGFDNGTFSQTTLTVTVAAVCGETDLSDNSAKYTVLFRLG
jgi:hypothetical protein